MSPPPLLRPAQRDDCEAIARIYRHFVAHSVATFDETPPTADDFRRRLQAAHDAGLPWWVCVEPQDDSSGPSEAAISGFACANPWKTKSAYRYCAETSIYLQPDQHGRGRGLALYQAFLSALDKSPIRHAIACISLPNPGSIRLHEQLGFSEVGRFKRVGYKFERWIDVGYWQRESNA